MTSISKLKKMKKDELIAEVQKLEKLNGTYVDQVAALNKRDESRVRKIAKLESDVTLQKGKYSTCKEEVEVLKAQLNEAFSETTEEKKTWWSRLIGS